MLHIRGPHLRWGWSPHRLLVSHGHRRWKRPWRSRSTLWRGLWHVWRRRSELLHLRWRHLTWLLWLTLPGWLYTHLHGWERHTLRGWWAKRRKTNTTICKRSWRHWSTHGTIGLRTIGKCWGATSEQCMRPAL